MRRALQALSILAVLLFLTAFAAPVAAETKPLVVVTTSILGSIVKDLAGDEVDLIVLMNPSACPAHYDIKPSDVYAVSEADLIMYHGFEKWIVDLHDTSGSKAELVKVPGPWNTPEGVRNYYVKVADALKSSLGIDVSARLNVKLREINETLSKISEEARSIDAQSVKVIVMTWQKDFVKWLGFRIVGEFGPPEKLSSADIEKIVKLGKNEGAALVISNLQSGIHTGARIAEEIGAVHVVLSNFPGTDPETNDLVDLLKRNAEKLFDAVKLYSIKRDLATARSEAEFYMYLAYSVIVIAVIEAALLAYALRRVRGGE